MLSQAVTRRTQEFGVRMALGAGPIDIVRLVAAQGSAAGIAMVLVVTAAAAIYIPALRAASIEPLTALRSD